MASLVSQTATPLDKVPDLGEALIAKLHEAGITTVEALADMTPEQLEELPGVGPKTVEKISIAVNNYFSSLESAGAPAEAAQPVAGEEGAVEAAAEAEGTAESGAEVAEGSQAAAGDATVEAPASAEPAVAEASAEAHDVPENETPGERGPGEQET